MPDVKIVRAGEPWAPTSRTEQDKASALALMSQLLSMQDLIPRHHKEQLSIGLWKWTEAEGLAPNAKYNTRYVSAGVKDPDGPARINHEHVWTRNGLITQLLARKRSDSELEEFLTAYGVACIVTTKEHGRLGGQRSEGWQRYADAGIGVWDRGRQAWLDLRQSPPVSTASELKVSRAKRPPRAVSLSELAPLIDQNSRPAGRATLLHRLVRQVGFQSAVAVPSFKQDGELSDYFRIHDAMVEEPTRAVAYAHWSGKVDFALLPADLPRTLVEHSSVGKLKQDRYAVTCKVTDDESFDVAEELLFRALDKLRSEYDAW